MKGSIEQTQGSSLAEKQNISRVMLRRRFRSHAFPQKTAELANKIAQGGFLCGCALTQRKHRKCALMVVSATQFKLSGRLVRMTPMLSGGKEHVQ
jgi:hypothetical protein